MTRSAGTVSAPVQNTDPFRGCSFHEPRNTMFALGAAELHILHSDGRPQGCDWNAAFHKMTTRHTKVS